MRVVRIHAAAAEEAAEAAAWYEKERPGLGSEFGQAIEVALDLLEEDIVPLTSMPGPTAKDVKRLLLRRFPYAIVVLERGDEILVLAIAHHARRPGYWRNRSIA